MTSWKVSPEGSRAGVATADPGQDVNFTLFGLGDTSYDKYNYAAKLLNRRLLALGARPMVEPAYGDERAPDGIEEQLVPWLKQTADTMSKWLEPVPGHVHRDITELDDPIYAFDWQDEERAVSTDLKRLSLNGTENGLRPRHNGSESDAIASGGPDGKSGFCEGVKPDGWVWARLRSNRRVTDAEWYQDVRDIELELEAGDA